jgi:hypothetical protein
MAEKNLTLENLQELCSYWQERLGLSHWQIGIRITRERNMPRQGCLGNNELDIVNECALISILDPSDYPDTPFRRDMETTLVHELLHIPMEYIVRPENGTLENVHLEATISRLAYLLVMLRRGDNQE